MNTQKIERVDGIPLIVQWLLKMRMPELIDAIWQPHGHWQGLSYGQLALLLLEVLGEDEAQSAAYQQQQSQHLIRAYALPTAVARYDTTTFSVYHDPAAQTESAALLSFGYSKDRRPDLRQYKLGVSTLDPAGMPLLSDVLAGKGADDSLYLPAWRNTCATLGHRDFLFVADSKASALETRATLAAEGGRYLFPQTMTGDVPELLAAWVAEPPTALQAIVLDAAEDPIPIAYSGSYQRPDAGTAGGPASADPVGICSPTGTGTAGGSLGRLGPRQSTDAHGPPERRTTFGGL